MLRNNIIWAVVFFACLVPNTAYPYSWSECHGHDIDWGNSISFDLRSSDFPTGSVNYAAFNLGASRISQTPGVNLSIHTHPNNDDGGTDFSFPNLDNEVKFGSAPSGAIAYTHYWYLCFWSFGWHSSMEEADIIFKSSLQWNGVEPPSFENPAPHPYNITSVAEHELGHAVGLDHESVGMNNMFPAYPNGGPLGGLRRWEIHADFGQGLRQLYGDSSLERNIYLSHYGMYPNGAVYPLTLPTTGYRGDPITVRYSLGNNGTMQETLSVSVYLSTDSTYSSNDIYLSSWAAWTEPGASATIESQVTVPEFIPTGVYRIILVAQGNNDHLAPESILDDNLLVSYYTFTVLNPPSTQAPVGVSASDGLFPNHVRIQWANQYNGAQFRVYRNYSNLGCLGTPFATVPAGTFFTTDSQPPMNQVFYYSVKAVTTAFGESPCSLINSGYRTPIPPPTQFLASQGLPDRVRLSWQLPSAVDGIKLYRSASSGTCTAINATLISEVLPNGTITFTDYPPLPNVHWRYFARSVESGAESICTELVNGWYSPPPGLPLPPTLLNVSIGELNQIHVDWGAASGAAGYYLYRSETSEGCTGDPIAEAHPSPDLPQSGTEYFDRPTADNKVTAGKMYYYSVRSHDSGVGISIGCSNVLGGYFK